MSGLLALLDDVAALAKVAAVQIDDIAGQAAKVTAKTAGIVIDDTAVTPKYVHGLPAARELPIVWQIARASVRNKVVILLPAALLLETVAPWALSPLLMLGGAYLCFEGAEKIAHLFVAHDDHGPEPKTLDAAHLERTRVAGAIKTDFILSAEIMTISLAAIEADDLLTKGGVLGMVAVGITAAVYGAVAVLVKADDVGLRLAQVGRLGLTRALGRGIVKGMPGLMRLISGVGTAAMLWVGGSIIIHGLKDMGAGQVYDWIHHVAEIAAHAVPSAPGAVGWAVTAGLDGLFGLAFGLVLMPIVAKVLVPLAGLLPRRK